MKELDSNLSKVSSISEDQPLSSQTWELRFQTAFWKPPTKGKAPHQCEANGTGSIWLHTTSAESEFGDKAQGTCQIV